QGRATFTFPATGRYRLLRRWRPKDPAYARALENTQWKDAELEVVVAPGKPPRVPPLAATGAPEANAPAPAHFAATTRGYRVPALAVQESIPEAIVSYDFDPTRVWLRASRVVRVMVEVTAPDPDSRAALAA